MAPKRGRDAAARLPNNPETGCRRDEHYHSPARPLYATVALFVAAIQVLCAKTLGPQDATGTLIAISAGFALRLIAYRRGWQLPRGLDWQPRRPAKRAGQAD
ncbi:MAG: rane protein [Actinomycetia bacterium]|nr:rane protein [Actinomycetes bacterium]